MKAIIVLTSTIFFGLISAAQSPAITWQKCLGSTGNDEGIKVSPTTDGGVVMIGHVGFTNGDVSGGLNTIYPSGQNIWVCKLSSTGTIQWKNMLGSAGDDFGYSIKQTADGGYILCGTIIGSNTGYPFDTDVSQPSKGGIDCWVVKLSSTGGKVWEKNYGGSSTDQALDIIQTADGGYAFTGWTNSTNGDITSNPGNSSYWLVKLTSTGSITWQKCYGGTLGDFAQSLAQTTDGGYAVAGYTLSTNGDITASKGGGYDYWIVKANSTGTLEWQKSLGGSMDDRAASIQQYADGNLLVLGTSKSSNGDKTSFKVTGTNDTLLVKLTSLGSVLWNKAYGSGSNEAREIAITSDGGFITVSDVGANGFDVTGKHGSSGTDMWVAKANAAGDLQWQLCLGGSEIEYAQSIVQSADGSYYVCGITRSNDGDVSGIHTSSTTTTDAWVVKLAAQTLPLNFGELNVSLQNHVVNIQWETFNETGISHFNIERSIDGNRFVIISTKTATNRSQNSYVITDNNQLSGTLRYRVQSVGADGQLNYSAIKTIQLKPSSRYFNVYPNPADASAVVHIDNPVEQITIMNETGKVVLVKKHPQSTGNLLMINTTSLATGMYVIRVLTRDETILYRMMVMH